jgi:competence protein ComEA
MNQKWRFLIIGLLAGSILSGIIFFSFQSIMSSSGQNDNLANTPFSQMKSPTITSEIGKKNINTCTLEELDQLPGIGEVKAKAIIQFRETYGNFENIMEILYVPGISKNVFNEIRDMITVK